MTEEAGSNIVPTSPDENEGSDGWWSVAVDAIGATVGKLPAVISRNVAKAFNHLLKIPNTWVDGKAAEIKANSDARVALIKATGKSIAKQITVDPSIAAIAADTHASKILRQTVNTAKVLQQTAQDLQQQPPPADQPIPEITDDWLNAFEQEAANMSSEHMQKLFGKILAGEIRKPTSYSIRTLKLMAQLDNRPAALFQRLCSLACTLSLGSHVHDSRVITLSGAAASNGLQGFGLGFSELNILFEYGLIIGDYNSYMMYVGCIVNERNMVSMPFTYQNQLFALAPKTPMTPQQRIDFKVSGVQLSRAGMELLGIVDIEEDPKYTQGLMSYFDSHGFNVLPVAMPPTA